jgi:hypothetical protein
MGSSAATTRQMIPALYMHWGRKGDGKGGKSFAGQPGQEAPRLSFFLGRATQCVALHLSSCLGGPVFLWWPGRASCMLCNQISLTVRRERTKNTTNGEAAHFPQAAPNGYSKAAGQGSCVRCAKGPALSHVSRFPTPVTLGAPSPLCAFLPHFPVGGDLVAQAGTRACQSLSPSSFFPPIPPPRTQQEAGLP